MTSILLIVFMVLTAIMPNFTAVTYASEVIPEEEVALEPTEDVEGDVSLAEQEDEQGAPPTEEPVEEPAEEPAEVEDELMEEPIEVEDEVVLEETLEELEEELEEEPAEEPAEVEDEPMGEPAKEEMKAMEKGAKDMPTANFVPTIKYFPAVENSILQYPLSKTALLTSGFGYRSPDATNGVGSTDHKGIDLAISEGTEVLSAERGVVTKAEYDGDLGMCVFVDHGNGLETRYAHLSEINVEVGQSVGRGQQIGRVGSTGASTGAHLHFEVLVDGAFTNPIPYLTETVLPEISFASKRLLVKADKEKLTEEPVIAEFGGIVLIQYGTEEETKNAYIRLTRLYSVEVDSVMGIAEGEPIGEPTEEMTDEENPFIELEKVMEETNGRTSYDVAVIDTGSTTADGIVSVLGDDGKDNNGHGQSMVDIIKVLSPNARVLSIKAIGDDGVGDISSVYSAILFAMESNVKVINLSISAIKTEDSFIIEQAIKDATEKGIMVVGSAGNNGADASLFVPAGVEEAIIVGAKDVNGDILTTSNRGSTVDLYVVSRSTSTATAMVSAYLIEHSDLSEIDSFLASIIPAERLVDIEFIKRNADDKVSTSNLSPIGFVHSIVTFASDEVDTIDELWEDEETAVDKYKGFIHGYVLVYNGSEADDYAVARLIEPNEYKGLVFKDYITARDNNKGEVIEGCIYDSETGLLYIPKSLLTLTEGEHQLNEVRVQLLYTGTLSSAQENEFVIQRIPTNMNAYHCADGASKSKASAHPTKSATVVVDRDAGFKSGTYSDDYYTYQGGEIYFSDSLSDQYNSKGNLSYMIINGEIDGFPYTLRELDTATWSASWEVELGEGTWELSDGTTVEFPGGTFYLVCNHVGISDTYEYFDDVYNNPGGATVDSAYIRILEVDEEEQMMYCGLIVPSRHTQSGAAIFKMPYEVEETGYATLTKTSTNTSLTNGNPCYNMNGIEYKIYKNSGTVANPVKAEDTGFTLKLSGYNVNTSTATANTVELDAGEYVVEEVESTTKGTGYAYNSNLYAVTVVSGETSTVSASDVPTNDPDRLSIYKATTESGNGRITHSSATFKVEFFANDSWSGSATRTWYYKTVNGVSQLGDTTYLDSAYSNSPLYEIGGLVTFPLGTVRVTEEKAPEGYLSSDFELLGEISLNTNDEPEFTWVSTAVTNKLKYESDGTPSILDEVKKGDVKIEKWDAETNSKTPQGSADFSGIKFDITNKSGRSVIVNDNEYANNEVVATITTDANGDAKTTGKMLPAGTYEIKEVASNSGYMLTDGTARTFKIETDGEVVTTNTSGNNLVFKNNIVRADLKFFKVNIDGSKQAFIPFLIERLDEDGNVVESHIILSDENGYVDTSDTAKRPKTADNVNKLDAFVSGGEYAGALDDASGNVWFGEPSAVANGKGSLVYSAYRVTELRSVNNNAEDMLVQFVVKAEDLETEFVKGKVFNLDNIFVNLIIHLESDLVDGASGTKTVSVKEDAEVMDKVRWDHLKVGQLYRLKTVVVYEDEDGNTSEIGENTVDFTPTAVDSTNTSLGITENTVTVDTRALNGGTLHAVDYIYAVKGDNEVLIATHNKDLNTESQMLGVPSIRTRASDGKTLDRVGTAEPNAEITDTISIKNMPEGSMFRVVERLVDRETEELIAETTAILRISNRVTEVSYKADGTIVSPKTAEIKMPTITIDASKWAGKTVVVQEIFYDYDTEEEYIRHDSLLDEDQSIYYIKVGTVALDELTETHTGAVVEDDRVIDTVKIENCIVGEEYTVNGKFVDKESQKVLATAEPVTVTATESTMYVEIVFELDARDLGGKSAVAYEYVYHNDVKVGEHEDPDDEDQIIDYPDVKTNAEDGETNANVGRAREETTIVDKISVTNLTVGEEYTVKGVLMNQGTKEVYIDADGNEVRNEVTFVATAKNMTVEMPFTFNGANLKGTSVVVFEDLETNGITIAVHHDINDKDQTVDYPDGRTVAEDSKTKTHYTNAEEVAEVVDTFYYYNLRAGVPYTLNADLVNKANGKVVATQTITFTPDEKDGKILVTFTFDASLLKGETLVAFETVEYNGVEVIVHKNLEDKEQTIYIPEIKTLAETPLGKITELSENAPIKDTVYYKNLEKGKAYILTASVVDKETLDVIKSEKFNVVAEEESGEWVVEMTIDTIENKGKTLVFFEEVEVKNDDGETVKVGEHKDPTDEGQTIKVPEIKTFALAEGKKTISPKDKLVLTDTIVYINLLKDREYEVTTEIADAKTGEILETAVTVVTATSETGQFVITMTVDASKWAGKTVVFLEEVKLIEEGKEPVKIAEHKDLNDKGQSVEIVDIVRTGDNSNMLLYVGVCSLAFALVLTLMARKRKNG